MGDTAKITNTDHGQFVELPEAYWFTGTAVRISREGSRMILEPVDDIGLQNAADEPGHDG